jgi:hypothetical protein
MEDIEEIGRLEEENYKLLVENRKLKEKLERKKNKIQDLKGNVEELAEKLSQARRGGLEAATTSSPPDYDNEKQYEEEQQELRRAALQNFQLAPFIDLPKEEESSIPFDDIGERIIVRDGKQIKQVKHLRGFNSNGEEIGFCQEWELTKQELEEIEEEKRKIADAEAAKQYAEDQIRISEEEPSIPYNDYNERIIFRDGKTYKQWFQYGFGTHVWYGEREIVDECFEAIIGMPIDDDDVRR